jgi:hypothetical protein
MSDFLQLEGGGLVLSKTHPPHDLRRRILHDRLSKGTPSYAAVLENATGAKLSEDFNSPLITKMPEKEVLFARLSRYDEEVAALLAELPESFLSLQSHIYDVINRYLHENAAGDIYSVEDYQVDLETHLRPLLAAIPPMENGIDLNARTPTKFASILNVGWAVVLTKLNELRVKTGDDAFGAEKLERLHGLLLKAVEVAEARRDWEMARAGDVGL